MKITASRSWNAQGTCTSPAYADQRDMWDADANTPEAAQAKSICLTCPARMECLGSALAEEGAANSKDRHGVRGGLTAPERRRTYEILRRRGQFPTSLQERRGLAPHGTDAAYRRHLRRKEPLCEVCRKANALRQQAKKESA
ncbi:WhiB family transcriptional regulator [Streptomyces sp. NPDC001635]